MNKYYKTNDGWFDFYVNAETGEKKAKLDKDDILVEKPEVDDFVSGYMRGDVNGTENR